MEDLLAYLDSREKSKNSTIIIDDGEEDLIQQVTAIELDHRTEPVNTMLSDKDIHQYLREMNQLLPSSAHRRCGKQLKDWTDSDLMVYLAFNQIPQHVVMSLFGKQIEGSYFVTNNDDQIIHRLMNDCPTISEDHAREVVKLVGKLNDDCTTNK